MTQWLQKLYFKNKLISGIISFFSIYIHVVILQYFMSMPSLMPVCRNVLMMSPPWRPLVSQEMDADWCCISLLDLIVICISLFSIWLQMVILKFHWLFCCKRWLCRLQVLWPLVCCVSNELHDLYPSFGVGFFFQSKIVFLWAYKLSPFWCFLFPFDLLWSSCVIRVS